MTRLFGVIAEQQTRYLAKRSGFRCVSQQLGTDRPFADFIPVRLFAVFRRLIAAKPVRVINFSDVLFLRKDNITPRPGRVFTARLNGRAIPGHHSPSQLEHERQIRQKKKHKSLSTVCSRHPGYSTAPTLSGNTDHHRDGKQQRDDQSHFIIHGVQPRSPAFINR